VTLRLKNQQTKQVKELSCWAVQVKEVGSCPKGEAPIEWRLLTTREVKDFESACEVVRAYALRWRVEEVHRTWKSGCGVEETGLSYEPFRLWATLLLCVAVRTERLKRRSRAEPEAPAEEEFSSEELQALRLLSSRAKRRKEPAAPVKLGEATLWVAEMGGYMGPTPSRGPPGSTVIQRGLDKLANYVEAFRVIRESEKTR